ncbi:MAG: AAA family ATPase [Solirubrobacteraceae bacterium]
MRACGQPPGGLTSANLVEIERALIATAVDRAGAGVARLTHPELDAAFRRSEYRLTAVQAAALRTIATSGDGVDVIEALAGTGKTYTAGAIRALCETPGYTVVGVAPTGRAARELVEQAGVAARTLDSQLLSIDAGWGLPERSVVIFDEAAMASTRQSARLLEHAAGRGVKVVAIGWAAPVGSRGRLDARDWPARRSGPPD